MVISTGMRTDIPAFYSKWFINRLREGYVLVRNPYNPSQVTRYQLSPEVVDLLTFCTKNPAPLFPYQKELEVYGQYWFVTITPYGKEIEPNVPDKKIVMEDFKRLSEWLGIDCVGWRYDPIFIDERYSVDWHIHEFEQMAGFLSGYTKTCVISFLDLYSKVKRNFYGATEVPSKERQILGRRFIEIARQYDMTIKPCAEGDELAPYGADCSGCMTIKTYENALKCRLDVPRRTVSQKKRECACLLGVDIGAYDTCGHLCRYCYANTREEVVRENMRSHDPTSPFLVGGHLPEDVIHPADQKSWKDRQMYLTLDD